MSRRRLRILSVLVLAAFALALLPRLEQPAMAAPGVSGKVVAHEVRHDAPAKRGGRIERVGGGTDHLDGQTGRTGPAALSYTSEVIDAAQRFDFMGVRWLPEHVREHGEQPDFFIEIRTSGDGVRWSDWVLLQQEEDMLDHETGMTYAAPQHVGNARYAQYRIWSPDGTLEDARSIGLTFMDVSDLNASPLTRLGNELRGALTDLAAAWSTTAAVRAPLIRTRAEWGADESLMRWRPSYSPAKKAVVHHTVTSNTYTQAEAAAQIRSVYYFHAVTRGWGDIGYNYVVDRFGTIWEGRRGGDDVVGAHATGWNSGGIGIATLGNYSEMQPSSAMFHSVAHLIAMELTQRGIRPLDRDEFTHREYYPDDSFILVTDRPPNILGHRDCTWEVGKSGHATGCPGTFIYSQMDALRQAAQNAYDEGYTNLVRFETDLRRQIIVGEARNVQVRITNVGRNGIGAADTRLSYRLIDTRTGAVAVQQGSMTALPQDLMPGQTVTVTAPVNISTPGRYVVRWDLFAEGLGWYSQVHGGQWRDQYVQADLAPTWLSDDTPDQMTVGRLVPVNVTLRNSTTETWPASQVKLSYHWVSDVTGRTVVQEGLRADLPGDVAPGQQVSVPIQVLAPDYPTRYQLQFDLVREGQYWYSTRGLPMLTKIVNVAMDWRASFAVEPAALVLLPGAEKTIEVTVRNDGTATFWPNGDPRVQLGSHWYRDGVLVEWNGPRGVLPAPLGPGESAVVPMTVRAPQELGAYRLELDLVLEGVGWASQNGVAAKPLDVTVKLPTYGASYLPGAAASASMTQHSVPMEVRNTGDFTWTAPSFSLAYHVIDAAGRVVVWDGHRTPFASAVAANESAMVQARVDIPSAPGVYTVRWDMVHEGVTWFSSKGVPTRDQIFTIGGLSYGARYDAGATPASMPTQMTTTLPVRVTNSSNLPFNSATNVFLAYHWYDTAGNLVVFDGVRTPLNVWAGQTATVMARVVPPERPGTYRLAFDLVHEGVTWFSGKGIATAGRNVSVSVPEFGTLYEAPASSVGSANQVVAVPVTVTNTGTLPWTSGPIYMAYHVYRDGALVVWDGVRTSLPQGVAAGQTVTLNATVRVPQTPGVYEIRWDLVFEGLTWFSGRGVPTLSASLVVQ